MVKETQNYRRKIGNSITYTSLRLH